MEMNSAPTTNFIVFVVALVAACGDTAGLPRCDPFADACDSGERCAAVFAFDNANEIVDAGFFCVLEGNVSENGLCRGVSTGDDEAGEELVTDDCAAGLFCATLGTERRCRALCDGATFGCGGPEFCLGLAMDPLLAVCAPADNCDLIEQDCDAGEGCYATTGSEGQWLSHCFDFLPPPDGTGEVGTACEFTGDCVPGSDCFSDPNEPGRFTCQAFCDPDAVETTCPAGQVCTPVSDQVQFETVPGLCE